MEKSGFPAKRIGPGATLSLLAIFLGLSLVTVELVQRSRYASAEKTMEAALEELQRRSRFTVNKNGDPELAPEGAKIVAIFERVGDRNPAGAGQWVLRLVRLDPADMRNYEERLEIRLPRRRRFFLKGPEFELKWVDLPVGNSIFALLHEVLTKHRISFTYDWPQKEG